MTTTERPLTCAVCGAPLTEESAYSTIRRRDGQRDGWVCQDPQGCLARRNAVMERPEVTA